MIHSTVIFEKIQIALHKCTLAIISEKQSDIEKSLEFNLACIFALKERERKRERERERDR